MADYCNLDEGGYSKQNTLVIASLSEDDHLDLPQPPQISSLKKGILVAVFACALAFTCGAPLNGNGVREMWRNAGIPCVAGSCPHTSNKLLQATVAETTQPDGQSVTEQAAASGSAAPTAKGGGSPDSTGGPGIGQSGSLAPKVANAEGGSGDRLLSDGAEQGQQPQGGGPSTKAVDNKSDNANSTPQSSNSNPSCGECKTATETDSSSGDTPVVCQDAEAKMKSWLKVFQSSELIFAFTGFFLDFAGPKITFATGEFILMGSIGLLALGYNWWAMVFSGLTTQFILNSVMCIGNVFSQTRNIVMATLSGSADIAQFLFPVGNTIGLAWPAFDYYAFLTFWACAAGVSALAGLLLLPMKPFPEPKEPIQKERVSESAPLIGSKAASFVGTPAALDVRTDILSEASGIPLWKKSLSQQLTSLPFILFSVIWMQLSVRLNAYIDGNEDILTKYGDDGSMGKAFSYIMPLSFIPCVFVGVITNIVGVVQATGLLNVTAIMVNLLSLIPSLRLQWVTVSFFVVFKSALFSIMFTFVAEVFGFGNFGGLTAIISFIGGVGTFVIGKTANYYAAKLNDWFRLNVLFLVMGIVAQLGIFYMIVYPPIPPKHTKECEETLHRKRLTTVTGRVGSSKASVAGFIQQTEDSMQKLRF